jgi:23S rRNA-/tRNA-specific pseudouridylate synthase
MNDDGKDGKDGNDGKAAGGGGVNHDARRERGLQNKKDNEDGKKRGMKPRSQRNRKRPRSDVHSNDELVVKAKVVPLDLNGEKVPTAPDYIRMIEPYPYTFASHAKARWIGRSVLEIYTTEFGSYPAAYYETAIEQGRILVSDVKVPTSYKIKGSDVLSHTVHRHEPAVAVATDQSPYVKIHAESDTLLAVDKPGTLPVHACGGYNQNSLMNLLEPIYGKLYTIHRLDRLTSGLTVLAKTSLVAKDWGKAIQERDACEKLYMARVKGRFPLNCPTTTLPNLAQQGENEGLPVYGEWSHHAKAPVKGPDDDDAAAARLRNAYGYWITDPAGKAVRPDGASLVQFSESEHSVDEWLQALKDSNEGLDKSITSSSLSWLHLACPVRVKEPKIGVCVSGAFEDLEASLYLKTVKSAQTAFAVIRYDSESDSTIVLCRPGTGRTHQIRLALQHMGHPIANDPNYGGDIWFGSPQGEKVSGKAQELLDAMDTASKEDIVRIQGVEEDEGTKQQTRVTTDVPATAGEVQRMADMCRQEEEPFDDYVRRTCVWCARSNGSEQDRTLLEFQVRSTGIWLHALQYTIRVEGGEKTSFRTDPPKWSLPNPASA